MRSNPLDAARRGYLGIVRGRFEKADDKPRMQTVDARHLHQERHPATERFQPYGHSSVPLPPDPNGEKAAETLTVYLSGNRAHPIVIAVDDRRHRPRNLKPGESTLYDDQGQQVYIARGGIKISGGGKKLPVTITVGSSSVKIEDGKITLKGDKIILDGEVHLGGADAGAPAAMQGTVDTAGNADISNLATKVFLK